MKKIRKNLDGMTLVEILVAMTLFALMFAMVMGIMIMSVRLNAETQVYDREIDTQVEQVERYNPMGAYIEGITAGSTNVSGYNLSGSDNKSTITFTFGSHAINVDGYSYTVNPDDETGLGMKFFSSTRPDTVNGKYWIRLINASSLDEVTLNLYLPKEDHGQFYQKNGTVTYTSQMSKTVEKNKALSVGFDMTDSGNTYFWASVLDRPADDSNMDADATNYCKIQYNNILLWADTDGYIDIYYTDDVDNPYKTESEYLSYISGGA